MEEMCPSPVGAQTEDKTQRAGSKFRLVRMRDNRRIEQSCRLQGEFAKRNRSRSAAVSVRKSPHPSIAGLGPVRTVSRKDLWICWCRCENSADTPSRSGPTWLSGSDMILAIILLALSEVSGLKRTQKNAGLVGPEDRGRGA